MAEVEKSNYYNDFDQYISDLIKTKEECDLDLEYHQLKAKLIRERLKVILERIDNAIKMSKSDQNVQASVATDDQSSTTLD